MYSLRLTPIRSGPTMHALGRISALVLLTVVTSLTGFSQVFWTIQYPAGITDDISCVTYANGTFAAVTNQGNVLTSPDGLTWSSQAVTPGTWLTSITYGSVASGNNTWIAVGANGTIVTSTDLKTWSKVASGTTSTFNGVYGGLGAFIVVGDGGTILTSADLQTWTIQPTGTTGYLHGFAFVNWGPVSALATKYHFGALVSGQGGVLLATGFAPSSPTLPTIDSPFRAFDSGTGEDLEALFSGAGGSGTAITLAVGANGTILYNTSAYPVGLDGSSNIGTWIPAAKQATSATFRAIAYGNGFFVTAGDQGTIMTSPDGITWTQRFSGDSPLTLSSATLLSVAFSPDSQRFVITGTGGTILVSDSEPSTFANVSTRGFVSTTSTLIGGFVIEGSTSRTVLIRGDGPALSMFGVPNTLPDPVLTVYNSGGVAIATNSGWTTNGNPAAISTAATVAGAFALPNPGNDSALLLTLPPGAYTVQITSAKGSAGTALFEAYME